MRVSLARAAVALALSGCAGAVPAAAGTPATPARTRALDYTVHVADDLGRMRVHACFEGALPPRLSCGVEWGEEFLTAAVALRPDGSQRPLPARGGRIDLTGLAADECVVYEIDVDGAAASYGDFSAGRLGGAMLSVIPLWLWRPPSRAAIDRVRVRFVLPAGAGVSVPWPRVGDEYDLDATAFAYRSFALVGRFERETLSTHGAHIDIAVPGGLSPARRAQVRPWLEAAVASVAQLFGRFPRERAQFVVVPGGRSSEPVGFGTATRGGGASVAVRLNEGDDLDVLKADWVAVHEFTHLAHPFVERDDAWLSEGLATYYQEVLRARAGLESPEAAWARILDGSRERRWAEGSLARESADMFLTFRFPTVYWGGAAVALMADVKLRERGDSLDRVLDALARCCNTNPAPWPAARVVAELDRIAGAPVFAGLLRREVESDRFPTLDALYRRLGIRTDGAGVSYDDTAPLAAVRRAIMAPRATPAPP